jgi:Carboxypeptidase regulatory-like domain
MNFRAIIAILLLTATTILAIPQTEIRVEVKDEKGRPVERASVILDFLGSHRQVFKLGRREPKHWEIRTNQQGVARFPSIPQGKIRVQVIAKTYQTFGDAFDIDDEQKTIEVTLKPPQKQYSVYGTSSDTSQPK